ncbi:MAG: ImmA/IrrE family metallo-endopeptidase [Pseudomonadota bacterium]
MIPKVIKTDEDYQKTLERIEELMDASSDTPEGDELDLLATLIELYENKHYPIDIPDPIEAIKFRMEQQDLNQQDLVPYIGSKSKVSEVLNRKRPLTLSMMRALHKGFGIPAEVLLHEQGHYFPQDFPDLDWSKFPIKDMLNKNWIVTGKETKGNEEEIMRSYIAKIGGMQIFSQLSMSFRKSKSLHKEFRTNRYALLAWCLRVIELAAVNNLKTNYRPDLVDLQEIAKLSYFENGPLLAKEYLEKAGIQFLIVPHLSKTFLDGAAMILENRIPIIALTLRYDRIDNFWFCLLHELAHLLKHLSKNDTHVILDELEPRRTGNRGEDPRENEADDLAQNALIPKKEWEKIDLKVKNLDKEVIQLAEELKIHPAIIAGRIRYEENNYRLLTQFIGKDQIRKLFFKTNINL